MNEGRSATAAATEILSQTVFCSSLENRSPLRKSAGITIAVARGVAWIHQKHPHKSSGTQSRWDGCVSNALPNHGTLSTSLSLAIWVPIRAWSLLQEGSQSNEIFLESNESSSIGAVIARLKDLIVTSGLTSMLRVLHDPIRHDEQSETLASFGFQYAFRTALMVRDILSKALPSADQRIIAAETRREYDAAISVMQEVFGAEVTSIPSPLCSSLLHLLNVAWRSPPAPSGRARR